MSLVLLPAVDVANGQAVRLVQGEAEGVSPEKLISLAER